MAHVSDSSAAADPPPALAQPAPATARPAPRTWRTILGAFGPGIMAGLADNDPAGVATYAIAGATAGFAQLWLLVLATFMVQAVQVTCARLGQLTHAGAVTLTKERYGMPLAVLVALIGIVANQATLIADTAAIGAAGQLLTGLDWRWFVLPAAAILLTTTLFLNFTWIRNCFMVVGLLLLSYVATAFLARPDWGGALHATFVPKLPATIDDLEAAVALLGTTISPYLIFWQVQGEMEERRDHRQFALAQLDITAGYVLSNLLSAFIIITTAATLFVNHQTIKTAADAANALQPLLGNRATVVFALGLLGTGLLAVPMFAISTSFVAAELCGWPAGLSKRPTEARGFSIVLAVAFLSGALAALLGMDPIMALFDSQILDGLLMPILIALLLLLANSRRVVGAQRNPPYYNLWLGVSFVVMAAAAIWLIGGLCSGQ